MSNQNEYNGWTNYQTWNVKLWIDNDQGEQEYWLQRAAEIREELEGDYDPDWQDEAIYNLAEELQEQFQDRNPIGDKANVFSDLLGHALACVDWREIALALIEDAEEIL